MLTFRSPDPRDFGTAARFCAVGMHFDKYAKDPVLANLTGRAFLALCLDEATEVIAAYENEELTGLLIAQVYGQAPAGRRFSHIGWLVLGGLALLLPGVENAGRVYGATSPRLLRAYRGPAPDGEITFLAVNPDRQGRGTGRALVEELARRQAGKRLLLFTDDSCNYRFYDHLGFDRIASTFAIIGGADPRPLECMLYMKAFPAIEK